ncbi:MAG: hypothetical protein FJ291_10870 [Planctomycetes bacterium]|nr:hypothetical protein [Planctomycetota bacterium]
MTKKRAFLTAMANGVPDAVPVSPLIHCRFAHKVLGRTDWRAVFEVHQMIGSTHYRGPLGVGVRCTMPEGYRTERQVLFEDGPRRRVRTTHHTPAGSLTCVTESGFVPGDPIISVTTERLIKGPADWRIFLRMQQDWNEHAGGSEFGSVAEAFQTMGEEGVASVGLGGVYAALGEARGMAELMYDLFDCPDVVREVQRTLLAGYRKRIQAFLDSPSEACFYDICWATGSNLGPKLFEAWVAEEVRQACDMVRAVPGKLLSLYTLGKMRALLPIFVEAGPHAIATFDPNQGDVGLREAKRLYGHKIAVMGNLDCVVLARGSIEDCRREALRCLDEAKAGGGYILGTADEVPADTTLDKLKAVVDAAAEEGRYDLQS